VPKKSIACEMGYVIGHEGIEKAIEKFAQLKKDSEYYINEYEFNQLAKELQQNYNKINESKEIYVLALKDYPNSFLLNYSYGTLLYDNKKEEFIDYFKKCVDLYSETSENKKYEDNYEIVLKRISGEK
jgi:predicted Zn-dependent protease